MASTIQERAQYSINQLDKELSRYKPFNDFEKHTSVPKVYVVIGLGALYFLLIFLNIGGEFLVNTAGFVLPAYYSMSALFTSSKADDTQWLTYWVVYAFLTVIESAFNAAYWFPFYYTFKFILVLWMALPATNGAQVLFHSFLNPVFSRYFSSHSTASELKAQAEHIKAQAGKAL